MGSADRRKIGRPKRDSFVIKGTEIAPNRTWGNEVFATCILLLATFLLLSFLSHQVYLRSLDPSAGIQAGPRANVMGAVGHITATVLFGSLGWGALTPVIYLLWLGTFIWRFERWTESLQVRSKAILLIGLLLSFLASAVLFAIFAGRPGGGAFGMTFAEPLRRYFGSFGATIIVGTVFVLAAAVASKRSVLHLIRGTAQGILISLGFLFGTVPLTAWHLLRGAGSLGKVVWDFVYLAITGSHFQDAADDVSDSEEEEDEEEDLPKPKERGKRAERKEPKAPAQPAMLPVAAAEAIPEEDYSHVVVRRRQAEKPESASKNDAKKPVAKEALIEEPHYESYIPPALTLLQKNDEKFEGEPDDELRAKSRAIEEKLRDFSIQGKITQVHPGPVVTLFEFEPAAGVKVGRIAALQDDLAMSLRASSIRVIAPLPKKGTVGIEVPNRHREVVRLRDLLDSNEFKGAESLLTVPLGKDTYGDPVVSDIATMPHLLVAGATGTGKSVFINTLLVSMLYRASPADLGLILIDPKILELSVYDGIPHLRVPVVTVPTQARAVLQWAVKEMDRRYRMMQHFGVRNIDGYNRVARGEKSEEDEGVDAPLPSVIPQDGDDLSSAVTDAVLSPEPAIEAKPADQLESLVGEKLKPLPKIVIVIDELADLMLTVGREVEELITRLAQKARAAGIHLIVATQRPSVDVITGLIKANFPARLSFRVTTRIDSRTILDSMGAEKLLGRGDMLVMQAGAVHLRRVHGAFISDSEVKKIVEAVKKSCKPQYDEAILKLCEEAEKDPSGSGGGAEGGDNEYDEFYDKAVELVLEKGQASTSMVQRVFRIGYNRAARIIETMERDGIIGPMDGVKPREVIIESAQARLAGGK